MPIILFRLVTAAKSMARKSSEGVCHTSGNGVGIKCKIGTLKKTKKHKHIIIVQILSNKQKNTGRALIINEVVFTNYGLFLIKNRLFVFC